MIIYGIHPVMEALESADRSPECIWITRGKAGARLQKIIDKARLQGIAVRFEPALSLTKKAETERHQGVVARIESVPFIDLEDLLSLEPKLLVIVDSVEDPRNLGGLLRTAEGAGVEGVLIPLRRSSPITPVVIKASAGATAHLRLARIGNVAQTLERLKKAGFWTVGLDMEGSDQLDAIDFSLPLVVVVGGEHAGIRRRVRSHCDFLVSLPMKGSVTSLNLSVAAGILLYQIAMKKDPATQD
jgi:23S rRNA (guanosine2251-2'-O)-methyltransferase